MTDDEAITLAILHHGGPFVAGVDDNDDIDGWFVDSDSGEFHPVEAKRRTELSQIEILRGVRLFETLADLAHAYCEYYKLELTPCLPETSSLPPSS